ncbi:hypothetical protein KBD33_05785 [Candidatus Gracilibacteria bacterium]|nr:hypothetical protein [Candidatus Gracilibacteria bacterium]
MKNVQKSPDLISYPKDCKYWHGTTALQYGNDGEIISVIENILQSGIVTHEVWTKRNLHPQEEICLARKRWNARIYAMTGNTKSRPLLDESELYKGNSRWWRKGTLEMMSELGLDGYRHYVRTYVIPMILHNNKWRLIEGQYEQWIAKYTQQKGKSPLLHSLLRSDIAGNYPVIIGIRDGSFDRSDMSRTPDLAKLEMRTKQTLTTDYFTHIEVPRSKVNEVEQLAEKLGLNYLPILSMEEVESQKIGFH